MKKVFAALMTLVFAFCVITAAQAAVEPSAKATSKPASAPATAKVETK